MLRGHIASKLGLGVWPRSVANCLEHSLSEFLADTGRLGVVVVDVTLTVTAYTVLSVGADIVLEEDSPGRLTDLVVEHSLAFEARPRVRAARALEFQLQALDVLFEPMRGALDLDCEIVAAFA